jgi:hypothetical protein
VLNPSTDGATLNTVGGGTSGVYYSNGKTVGGYPLADVDFSFDYHCQPGDTDTTTCVGGGAPRWSIPIDTGGDPKNSAGVYAFLDAYNCGLTGIVSTNAVGCRVVVNTGGEYANWDAFAAANPTYSIASAYPFVIADVVTPNAITLFDVAVTK